MLERVIGEPAAIVGHSLEAGATLASERPDLVRAVIAIDAPVSAADTRRTEGPDRERLAWMRSLHDLPRERIAAALRDMPMRDRATGRMVQMADVFGNDDALFDDQADTLLQNDPAMIDAVIEFEGMHAGYEAERLLPRIECPVLLLLADAQLGSAVSVGYAARAVELLRDAVVRVGDCLASCGGAGSYLSAIEEFLDRL